MIKNNQWAREAWEEIEDIDFDKFDKFSEIETEIDNILDKGNDDE